VILDFFDTDGDDRIVEHWDVIAEYSPETPSGHTSVDGPTEVIDLDSTGANKALVRVLPPGEHWDAAEPIGPEAEWVNSGKF
jgi:hypothetical protein